MGNRTVPKTRPMIFPSPRRECFVCFLILLHSPLIPLAAQEAGRPRDVQLTIETNHQTAQFDPRSALGAGLDGHWQGEEARMLSLASVRQMLQAGLGPISFRLRTELAVDAWHWNPRGSWSDPRHRQGYWTSDAQPRRDQPILVSYGYKLPRRGNTRDEANDDGYSMLDDGDPMTFWKSNPYLAHPFTGEPDSHHPGWVVLEFQKPVPIDAIQIHWADPYATRFDVEYSTGGRVYFGGHPNGVWQRFERGKIVQGTGGTQLLKLSQHPVKAQYLRIWMTESSGTAAPGSSDLRDRLGYAIGEISAGWCDASGALHDQVIHAPGQRQTIAYVSSTDPWHRAIDRDRKVEQPGVDLVFRSGITRSLPAMLAVPVLYGTPEDALSLVSYVKQSGYPIERYELGEEPDGQRVDPRDFATLYAQVAQRTRKVVPQAVLGGPSFVTADVDYLGLSYRQWIREARRELARRGQSGDLQFLSFEWYPFDDVLGAEARQVRDNTWKLEDAMTRLRSEHLPLVLGEFNYSAYFTEHEVDLGGALLNAETAAQFLCGGGRTAYYYGYEPARLQGKGEEAAVPVATFHAMRLVSTDWMDPHGGPHRAFRVHANLGPHDEDLLSAFALERPDKSWSLLMLNKDAAHPARITLAGVKPSRESGTLLTYSAREYRWHADGRDGHPERNATPARSTVRIDQPFTIPPWSISVLHIKAS